MTKAEQGLLVAMLVFGALLYLLSKEITFAVGLPSAMFVVWCLIGRVFSVSWLVWMDEEQAAFRKPAAVRVFFGVMALASAGAVVSFTRDGLPWRDPADAIVNVLSLAFLGVVTLVFVWGVGPMETRFDLRRGRVMYRVGPPVLGRGQDRDMAEATGLRVISSGTRGFATILVEWERPRRALGVGVWFGTVEAARSAAEHIGGRLGLTVEVPEV